MGKHIKWTMEVLKFEALKYTSRVEFQKANKSAYNSACRQSLLDEICKHMNYFQSKGIQIYHIKEHDWLLDSGRCINQVLDFLGAN